MQTLPQLTTGEVVPGRRIREYVVAVDHFVTLVPDLQGLDPRAVAVLHTHPKVFSSPFPPSAAVSQLSVPMLKWSFLF